MLEAGCTFDESLHCYYRSGIVVPSVTRIMDHAGLASYDMVRADVLERKAVIGKMVHLATRYNDLNDLDWSTFREENPADRHVRGCVNAWVAFRAETGFKPRRIEEPFIATVNSMTFGMTIDREGDMGNREAVVEIKTASVAERWWALQLAGYALGTPDHTGRGRSARALFAARRRFAVQLFPDGSYKKFDYTDPQDADVFISSLHVTQWKLNRGYAMRKIEEEVAA
jgi:hypothetical protein